MGQVVEVVFGNIHILERISTEIAMTDEYDLKIYPAKVLVKMETERIRLHTHQVDLRQARIRRSVKTLPGSLMVISRM